MFVWAFLCLRLCDKQNRHHAKSWESSTAGGETSAGLELQSILTKKRIAVTTSCQRNFTFHVELWRTEHIAYSTPFTQHSLKSGHALDLKRFRSTDIEFSLAKCTTHCQPKHNWILRKYPTSLSVLRLRLCLHISSNFYPALCTMKRCPLCKVLQHYNWFP